MRLFMDEDVAQRMQRYQISELLNLSLEVK